ncbi:MAG TPA: hypothetical protein VJZ03_05605 [Candidatus Bathyarchaeia archaeon]|nr:hypothetical protein [Candidatus Bathyarchaeia archaeon]
MHRGLEAILLVVLAVLLVSATTNINPVFGEPAPTASVVAVTRPNSVPVSSQFQVTVTVDYSDKFLADVGVWNSQSGKIVQSVTLISNTTGPGESNFTFQITSPSSPGDWNLVAVTRVWWQNAWYSANNGAFPFVVQVFSTSSVSTLTLTFTANANTTLSVDGVALAVASQGVSVQVQPGIHSIEAIPLITEGQGERLIFIGWSDGVASNPCQIVIDQNTTLSASYRTEYLLNVQSPDGLTAGGGWYEGESQATFAAVPNYTAGSWFGIFTKSYTFSGWIGDSNATEASSSILMDGSKTVTATWVETTTLDIGIIGDIFMILAVPLMIRGIYCEIKRREPKVHRIAGIFSRSMVILTLLGLIIVGLMIVPPVKAQLPIQSQASIVRIGDADWYYWGMASSDTCVLWLGGGIQESGSGTSYAINPFDYESFGTIRFMQDLSQYYCVLALQKGSAESFDPTSNRTIYQEPYQDQSTIISDVHEWVIQHGYQHTFLIGYSVGGEAAVTELAVRDPTSWTASDGLILITVPLPNGAIEAAPNIHASIMLLYGGNLPDYESTGMQFYQAAPNEGWHGSYYFHKEFHVFQNAGHEVWTIRNTGAYDSQAFEVTVNFIETCKALQLKQNNLQQTNGTFRINSVFAPEKVPPGEVFLLQVNLTSTSIPDMLTVLIADDNQKILSTMTISNSSTGLNVPLIIPASTNTTALDLSIIVLQEINGTWFPVSLPYNVTVSITNLVTLTVEGSTPNSTIMFDGVSYSASATGELRLQTSRGTHMLEVQPICYVDNMTRKVFVEWEDTTVSDQRTIVLSGDTQVFAVYQTQYFVNMSTPYGQATGSGWYDEGSTVVGNVQPIILQQPSVIFSHWEGASTDASPRIVFTASSPTTSVAVWYPTTIPSTSSNFEAIIWVTMSILAFTAMLVWNFKLNLSQGYSETGNVGTDRINEFSV